MANMTIYWAFARVFLRFAKAFPIATVFQKDANHLPCTNTPFASAWHLPGRPWQFGKP